MGLPCSLAGRADGIQPRTLEVLKNMQPLGDELFNRSSASYERTFWDPTEDGEGVYRARRVQSFPSELEIEDGATLGLQQGEWRGLRFRGLIQDANPGYPQP